MGKVYAVSRNGMTIRYKCYKLKKPFQKLCEYDDPQFSDCVPCKFFRAEMLARDVERLLNLLSERKEKKYGITN
jgi:hypothetical protein